MSCLAIIEVKVSSASTISTSRPDRSACNCWRSLAPRSQKSAIGALRLASAATTCGCEPRRCGAWLFSAAISPEALARLSAPRQGIGVTHDGRADADAQAAVASISAVRIRIAESSVRPPWPSPPISAATPL
ncbi:hypothetical protein BH77_01575 [Pseudomonas aeruginosa C2773C]|nr:hypothetical protein BH77_01575 [Pseudomonas aeruginosa C2773C]